MTKILPFSALIFNQDKNKNLSKVVCPPYDVISPADQKYYLEADPHNFIHVLFRKDSSIEDKYKASAECFRDWIKEEVLVQDKSPAIYFYSHQYKIKGETKVRLGFISLLRLPERSAGVFGHEHTRTGPKEDRFKLLRQVKANLSPIFAIFADNKRVIQRLYRQHIQNKEPFIEVTDRDKCVHKIWRLDSPEQIDLIQSGMEDENIFIADGHHRYEVACNYREEMRQKLGKLTGDESFNYVLAYFTNTDLRGLTILPIHRLVKMETKFDLENFKANIKDYFDIEEIKDKTRFFFLLEKCGNSEHVLGMYKDKKFWLLRLKNVKMLDKVISDKPKESRSLDVSILNYLILRNAFGFKLEEIDNHENLTFSNDAEKFIEEVDANSKYVAFFLNPVKMQQIISVALNGNKMPAKSTFFYPKVLSGLLIHKFKEDKE
ncbi:MAG: DUF1015 domain-containing protein [Candidatus Omnitrophica bacterium]|nr:DUF1015 domain-containing protein [Candidatus Omnitrophota bacterium]